MFDFDKIEGFLARCNAAPNDVELRKVFASYRADYETRLPSDPFSDDYRRKQFEIYENLAGKTYAPSNEISGFDPESASVAPFPYSNDSCELVGNQLIAIGFLIKHLGLKRGSKLLEFGPGWGNTTLALAKMGIRVTAIDIERNFCDLIRRRSEMERLEITVVNADFSHIESLERDYDAILFFECFHHASDHHALMSQFDRVLKPGGIVCFAAEPITPDFPIPWGLRMDGESIWAIRRNGWLELGFNERYFEEAMKRHGWDLQWHRGHDSPWASVVIAKRHSEAGGEYTFARGEVLTSVGKKTKAGSLASSGQEGYLAFGPYIKLERGRYRATFLLERGKVSGVVDIDVCYGNGENVVAKQPWNLRSLSANQLSIEFELTGPTPGVEVRLYCHEDAQLTVNRLRVERL